MNRNPDTIALGIDLGGTKILSAVINSRGEILAQDYNITPAEKDYKAIIEATAESVGKTLDQAQISISELITVGLAVSGPSNPQSGILYTSPHLPVMKDVPILDIIEKKLGKKTFLINDANAAAFGEMRFGAARGFHNIIYITLSTGIGGGIIIDGRIYAGTIGTAGEIGHMTINDEGPICDCGNRGCWETLASGTALAREATRRIGEGAETSILRHAGEDIEKITAKEVHAAARENDNLAKELITVTGYYVGVGLANLVNIFNPEIIVIGGGLSNIGDMLLKPAYEEAKKRAFAQPYQSVRFARAELGSNSGVIGAAVFALDEIEKLINR